MNRDEITAKVREILGVICRDLPPDQITEASSFRADLRLDSLDLVDLQVILQRRFGFKAPEERYVGVDSVGRLVDLVLQILDEQKAAGG